MSSEGQDEKGEDGEKNDFSNETHPLSLKDKLWVVLAITLFVILFVAIFLFGIY